MYKGKVFCTLCGAKAVLKTSFEFYGKDYGNKVWDCTQCEGYVSANKHTDEPLGTFADKHLREWRMKAHEEVDVLWKTGEMTRSEVYTWIQECMDLSEEEAHIGKFNEKQCLTIIESAKSLKEFLKK